MDRRRERGEITRKTVARQAAAIASVTGLSSMTLATVAEALGISKSSVQAAYPTKQDLQLGAIAQATEIFVAQVITPSFEQPEGLPRLRALTDAWLDYIAQRVFPGGCFMVSNLNDFDSRPGEVRDALARGRKGWLALLARQVVVAQTAGEVAAHPTASMRAFEIDALLAAANLAHNLTDDNTPIETTRELIALRLDDVAR